MSTTIEERLSALEGRVAQLEKPRAAAPSGIVAATDAECLGQYGDPEIRKDPPRWSGESFAGRRFSQTSPEYLECLAGFKAWAAAKDDAEGAIDSQGRPKSHWAKKDAALALGWARRLRETGPRRGGPESFGAPEPPGPNDEMDGDIPF
jgi:hypothetical protein